MDKCTICGNPVDKIIQQVSRTGGVLKEGLAHEVCHLRHIARVRMDKMEELDTKCRDLEDDNQMLETENRLLREQIWRERTARQTMPARRGLVSRLLDHLRRT
jgi:hypothetical protein